MTSNVVILVFIGSFIGSMLFQIWRDHVMLKRFRVVEFLDDLQLARKIVISWSSRIVDALIVSTVVTTLLYLLTR